MSSLLSWDSFDAYLFDIDGTLLHCTDAVHYFAFCNVLSKFTGTSLNLEGVTTHGNTDVGILRDAFALAGVPEESWRPYLPELCEQMHLYVEHHKTDLCANVLPAIREVLVHLRERKALLSIATGNLERIGKQKLTAAGLLDFFPLGAWSDAFEYRIDVFRQAVEQITDVKGQRARILAVGDTPADIVAAHENGLPILAVATGIYSYDELAAVNPAFCISSFADVMDASRDGRF
ncbi:MAG TPA: HAD hydrolase-like protein [Edaphobacter sp.]|nr:HAD hydrolase-like protein [Edaphobacter sp.]